MRMKIAIDTGAIISLQLSGLLKVCLKYFSFMIGDTIKSELKEIGKTPDALGVASANVLKLAGSGDIKTVKVPKEKRGEDEVTSIMEKHGCDFLVSDDIKFVSRVKRKHKNVHFSVFLIFILRELGEITREEARGAIKRIFERREWSENLIYSFAKELLG